ncbi:hypothetical protein [Longimicrobium sp.]|jgi:hypothetical protein|uniref:hypothetical protein n=1 Tax=Longimicrobium sp. TaxID=2029185 RepID=UPI002ED8B70F
MKRIALLAAALLLASCESDATLVSDEQLTFTASVAPSAAEPVVPQVMSDGGTIRVNGLFTFPCTTGTLQGSLQGAGRELTLRVEGQEPTGCFTALSTQAYQGVITGLDPGVYHVRVIHNGEAVRQDGVVFEGHVRVRGSNLR